MSEYLKSVFDTTDERRGWDFSRVQDDRDPVPWEYEEVVQRYLRPDDRVLDIGTGGGERFLALAPFFGSGVGTDLDPEMVRVARENTPASLAARVSFETMPAESLALPEASFDIVLNRHAPAVAAEVARLLRPGGYFVTQQIGGRNTQNLFEAFGWGSNGAYWEAYWRECGVPPSSVAHLGAAFREAGCDIVARGEYDVGYRFLDDESLVFWMKSVPLPEELDIERHGKRLEAFLARDRTPHGIATNEHRDLLVIRKRSS
jgi:SAM-dependent methyltransferase